jgi:hypothetical protein
MVPVLHVSTAPWISFGYMLQGDGRKFCLCALAGESGQVELALKTCFFYPLQGQG